MNTSATLHLKTEFDFNLFDVKALSHAIRAEDEREDHRMDLHEELSESSG